MDVAAFTIIWVGLALYAVLAGADFGVGVWVLASYATKRGNALREDALGYFGPVWEVNGLFLVFFVVGLITAFPKALGLLGTTLIPLVMAGLAGFVMRSGAYALLHYGPPRSRGPATWVFGIASVLAGMGLGYAASAPATGYIAPDELRSGFYSSAVALSALPLTLAASAHLSALVVSAYAAARGRASAEWYRRAALGAGVAVLPFAILFTIALADRVPHTRGRLESPLVIPMILGGVAIFLGTVAMWRRRHALAALLTFGGYFAGLVGGAFAQFPYMVYPLLTVHEAAAPSATLVAYLIITGVGAPLLVAALLALYHTTLGPERRIRGRSGSDVTPAAVES